MKLKKIKYIFLIILIIALGIQGVYILSKTLTLSTVQKVIIITIQSLAVIGFTYFHIYGKDQKTKRNGIFIAHVIIFFIYIMNLGYVLLFDPDFGRNVENLVGYDLINLKWLRTIQLFIYGYQIGVLDLESILMNIVGNFVIFMPMAYFLPFFFRKQRKIYIFILTIAVIVLGVEVFQVLLRTGSGDIDDWFLNVLGAVFLYLILNKPMQKLYNWLGRD